MPVYLVQAGEGGPVKIGVASDVAARLGDLQTAHYEELRLVRCIDGGRAHEQWLHRRFDHLRIRGEWFRFDPEMMEIEPPAEIKEPGGAFVDVLALWPSLEAIAEDTGATVVAVRKWRQRNRVPPEFWVALENSAARRKISGITVAQLAAMVARERAA